MGECLEGFMLDSLRHIFILPTVIKYYLNQSKE